MVGGLTEGRRHCKDVAMAFLKSDSTDVRADWRPVHGSPPFDALTHFSCCAVGDCVLVWGGLGSPSDSQPAVRGSAHLFDPQTRRWYVPRVDTPDEDSPCARYLHATCQHGRGMIIHGGIGREPPDKAVKMCGPDAVLSSTYQVECGRKRLRWIPIPAVTCKDHDEGNQSPAGRDCTPSGPLHKFGHAMCTLGGRLYTFGGFLVEHDSSSRPQRSHRDATTPSPHMRQDMITSKVTGSLHCLTLDGKTSEGSRSPAWMLLATDGGSLASPKPRFGHSMTAIDDRYIAVFGGFDDEGAAVPSDMVLLHFPTLIWSKPEVLGLPPSPRGYHSALGVGGQVLIFGGQEQRDDFIVDPALYVCRVKYETSGPSGGTMLEIAASLVTKMIWSVDKVQETCQGEVVRLVSKLKDKEEALRDFSTSVAAERVRADNLARIVKSSDDRAKAAELVADGLRQKLQEDLDDINQVVETRDAEIRKLQQRLRRAAHSMRLKHGPAVLFPEDELEWNADDLDRVLVQNILCRGGFVERLEGFWKGSLVMVEKCTPVMDHSSGRESLPTAAVQELQAISRLSHPNLVEHFGATHSGESICVICEVGFPTLSEVIADDEMSPTDRTSVVAGVSNALDYMHRLMISHQHVCPENVFIREAEDTVMAKLGGTMVARLTCRCRGVNAVPGPYAHRASDCGDAYQTDIFSFGLLSVLALTGCAPEWNKRHEQIDLIDEAGLQQVVLHCLQVDHTARPTAEQVYQALSDIAAGKDPCFAPLPNVERQASPAPTVESRVQFQPDARKPSQTARMLWQNARIAAFRKKSKLVR